MKKELELYLHIPFCIRKCEYCDFLSGPADEKSRRVYLDAMLRELAAVGPQAKEYEVISVYIGGGTPSLLPGDWMEELMEVVRDTYCLKKDAEISMEANPGTLTAINLAGYHRAPFRPSPTRLLRTTSSLPHTGRMMPRSPSSNGRNSARSWIRRTSRRRDGLSSAMKRPSATCASTALNTATRTESWHEK